MSIKVSTPSRLCLCGEHLDYLSLEVVTMAINLRFFAVIDKRTDGQVVIKIKDSSISTLNQLNEFKLYEEIKFNSNEPIVYDSNRDYFKSAINVIKKRGYDVSCGFSVKMDSEIPIGKGMCSSSTMIVAFIKAVLEAIDADIKDSKDDLVQLAYEAEVTEFNEPGGKMDHIASVYGGICHFDFKNIDSPKVKILEGIPEGDFILIDSKTQ
jgi:galactokinase